MNNQPFKVERTSLCPEPDPTRSHLTAYLSNHLDQGRFVVSGITINYAFGDGRSRNEIAILVFSGYYLPHFLTRKMKMLPPTVSQPLTNQHDSRAKARREIISKQTIMERNYHSLCLHK